jgi:FdhD protein
MEGRRRGQLKARIKSVDAGTVRSVQDLLAVEEPLEIRLRRNGAVEKVAVTMRTPGHDFELAAGFLFSEGLIDDRDALCQMSYCVTGEPEDQDYNIVTVELRDGESIELGTRSFAVTSACGVCGKASLDEIERRGIARIEAELQVPFDLFPRLPGELQRGQRLFGSTGGLHAAGLFSLTGEPIAVREDVGRHNAVDKLIGWALLEGKLPLSQSIMLVSGRTSFEIAQKCAAAGIPILASVSAPSSLALDVAKRFNLTLVGFLRGERFNIYHDPGRITLDETAGRKAGKASAAG